MLNLGNSILNSIAGGAIMAAATSAHLYLQGKITGLSGAMFKCLKNYDLNYNASLLLGMVFISAFITCFFDPFKQTKWLKSSFLEQPKDYAEDLSMFGFIVSGFLIGVGARLANGCTSGHGVCGLPRLSKRSIVAICLFMVVALISATFRYYSTLFYPSKPFRAINPSLMNYFVLLASAGGAGYFIFESYKTNKTDKLRDTLIAFAIGAAFSFGLIESGMVGRHVVVGFFTLGKIFNIRLAFVFATAVGINYFTFNYILKTFKKPVFKDKYDLPTNTNVDNKLIVGSIIFGIGWGFSGICPGAIIPAFYIYFPQSFLALAAMCGGMYLEDMYDAKITEIINKNALLTTINNTLVTNVDKVLKKTN